MDAPRLDLQRLRYFLAVADHEHVGRAARELHISQSPLSRQISLLESELGVSLFTREKKRLKLNPQGRALYADVQRLLEGEVALRRRARALATGSEGSVAVGYVEGAVYAGVLPRDLAVARRRAPALRVELKPMSSAAQLQALASGAIDLGYTYWPPLKGSALSARLAHEERFVIAIAKGTQADQVKRKLTTLDEVPFITAPESASPRGRAAMLAALSAIGLSPSVQVEATDPAILLALAAAGVGFAVVQESLRALAPRGVRFVPLPRRFALKLQVHVVMGRTSPAAALFARQHIAPVQARLQRD